MEYPGGQHRGGRLSGRTASPIVLASIVTLSVALGVVIGRSLPIASAQQGVSLGTPTPTQDRAKPEPGAPQSTSGPAPAGASGPADAQTYDRLARQYDQFQLIDRTFSVVADAVAPSVVHIVARKPAEAEERGNSYRFFEETGSGVIVRAEETRPELFVLTNHHVVQGTAADDVAITLHDGRVLRPIRVWTDPKADIAVLALGRDDLPAARLGDSDRAVVGTWVLALGSPFGLTHSVSHGIISARNRHEEDLESEGVENQEFLQTDAAINPGNSGGPLLNLRGEVVGINTAIASSGGGSEGVGFSIPVNLAKWILRELVVRGRVSRGALGVRLEEVHHMRAQELGLDRPRGARIRSVQDASPASEAGIRDGDVVLRFNGTDVLDLNHLINLVSMAPIGREAEVVLWRDRQSQTLRVKVADRDQLIDRDPGTPAPSNGPLRRPTGPSPAPTQGATRR